MADIFDKWDEEVDLDGLIKDIEEAAKNSGSFKEVPPDTYEVKIEKMELTKSKKGDYMVSIWFKIVSGEYKNSRIFYNQVVKTGKQILFFNTFLLSMDLDVVNSISDKPEQIFHSYKQYANLLMDCAEEIEQANLSFELEYGEGKNGYHTYKIKDVFEN